MDKRDSELDRLLRAAAQEGDLRTNEAPFGFDTRVVATWRSHPLPGSTDFWDFARIFRRVAVGATLLMVCASAGAFWQLQRNDELDEPTAIADTAIEAGAWQ